MLKRNKAILLTVLFLVTFSLFAYAETIIPQTSTLNGTVAAQGLIRSGALVKEGQVLLYVNSVVGTSPAVRANSDGTVVEVLVKPGDTIKSGQVVVKLKSTK